MKINRTVERSVQILELLSQNKDGLSLADICRELDIPKSSCFDIVETLAFYKMVEIRERAGKFYCIGIKSFIIGSHYLDQKSLIDIAKDKMEQIGDTSGKSVFLAEDNQKGVVYTYKYQPKNASVVATCIVGTTNEYYNTALGKCMLAFKSDFLKLVDELVVSKLIGDRNEFLQELSKIQQSKFALSNQQHQRELFCVAVPIYDSKGSVANAISLSGLYSDTRKCENEIVALKSVAEEISREIGYTGLY